MQAHYPALVVILPLLTAFMVSGAGWLRRRLCFPTAVAGLALTTVATLALLLQVLEKGEIHYRLGGWEAPWGILYVVDPLNGLVLAVVSVLSLINLAATRKGALAGLAEKEGAFYTLYVLFVTGLMGMVVTGDLFNLYVLLEVASLTSYALIAMGGERAPLSSLHYVFLGTIGACFYLLGVAYLYIMTGSLNMADVSLILPRLYGSKVIMVAFVFCMVGVWIKMAFFPLHTWLPNAYTCASSAVSSLIAPLMTKVMVYVMIRLMLSVFSPRFTFEILHVHNALVWISVVAIVMGGLLALTQKNLKRMLTYVLIAEIGYMVGGAWLGNRSGMTGSILHIMNDAVMTLCLFLAAGNIGYRIGAVDLEHLRGLFRKMPLTMAGFVAGALSVIGVPPSCGFFSKWYLLSGAIQAGHYGFMAALLLSSLINVILFFRVFEIGFFEQASHGPDPNPSALGEEAPPGMVIPLLCVAAGLIVLGLLTHDIVTLFVDPVIPERLAS